MHSCKPHTSKTLWLCKLGTKCTRDFTKEFVSVACKRESRNSLKIKTLQLYSVGNHEKKNFLYAWKAFFRCEALKLNKELAILWSQQAGEISPRTASREISCEKHRKECRCIKTACGYSPAKENIHCRAALFLCQTVT